MSSHEIHEILKLLFTSSPVHHPSGGSLVQCCTNQVAVYHAITNMSPFLTAIALAIALFAFHRIGRFILSTLRPAKYPPGPTPLPGLGNLHQLPISKSFLTFSTWSRSKQYGPILGLKIGPANLVVLNTASHVRQLLQDRSAALSARPLLPIPAEYVFPENPYDQPLWSNAEHHTRMRRALVHHTSAAGIAEAAPLHHAFAGRLAHDLMRSPEEWYEAIHTWAYDIALSVIFGLTTHDMDNDLAGGGGGDSKGKENKWMLNYRETHRQFLKLIEPGVAQLAGIYPIFAYLPDSLAGGWKAAAAMARVGFRDTYARLVTAVKTRDKTVSDKGESRKRYEPLVSRYFRERDAAERGVGGKGKDTRGWISDQGMEVVSGSVLDAAAGTIISTVLFLIQALATHPEVQRRAQVEIDTAWGRNNNNGIPPHEKVDLTGTLPYISAVVLETLRWRPPIPLSVPRMCLSDQVLDGYVIPAGTTVASNIWAIQHDPDTYDSPERFDPERFLRNPTGTKFPAGEETDSKKIPLHVFGVGRRACPGDNIALYQLGITIAVLLWAFDIVPDGEIDCTPETGMLEGLAVTPSPFRVKFVPRDENAAKGVEKEYKRANQVLAEMLGQKYDI